MKWAAWFVVLVACGDNHSAPKAIDAAPVVDTPPDAGMCMASEQCSDPAQPVCCLNVSPGGASFTSCTTTPTSTSSCIYIACRGAGDPCLTPAGDAGTCTAVMLGASQQMHWVCE